MSEFFGAIKLLIFAILLVMFMQIKFGERTLETRAQIWIHTSEAGVYLQEVGAGGAKVFEQFKESANNIYQKMFGEEQPKSSFRRTPPN